MSDVGVRERNDLAEKMSLAMSRRTSAKEWFQPGADQAGTSSLLRA
jgi:hypothetical protein